MSSPSSRTPLIDMVKGMACMTIIWHHLAFYGPMSDIAQPLAPALMARMKPGACLVLSGLLDVQADAVEAAYAELGKARRVQSGDWVALVWGE